MVSYADTRYTFQMEGIIQMFLSKSHELIIAFKKVCDYYIAVVITIRIGDTKDSLCFVLRQDRQDRAVFAQKQDRGYCTPPPLSVLQIPHHSLLIKIVPDPDCGR